MSATQVEKVSYDGAQVWRIELKGANDVLMVKRLVDNQGQYKQYLYNTGQIKGTEFELNITSIKYRVGIYCEDVTTSNCYTEF